MMRTIRILHLLEPISYSSAAMTVPEEWKKYRILYETALVDPETLCYVSPLNVANGTPFAGCKDLDGGVVVQFAKGGRAFGFSMTRADFIDAFPELERLIPEVQYVHTL